jgi:hypothetical protein
MRDAVRPRHGQDVVGLPHRPELGERPREVAELREQTVLGDEPPDGRRGVVRRVDADGEDAYMGARARRQRAQAVVQRARYERADVDAMRVEERDEHDVASVGG